MTFLDGITRYFVEYENALGDVDTFEIDDLAEAVAFAREVQPFGGSVYERTVLSQRNEDGVQVWDWGDTVLIDDTGIGGGIAVVAP